MIAAPTPQHPVNLWILDDDEAMCGLLVQQCRRVGWLLRSFHHPRHLQEALQGAQPDLLVLDQLLPEKYGLDVLNSLRQAGYTFPVVILSALGAPSDRIAGLEAGAADYLAKPFHFRELQLRIDRLLQIPPAESQVLSPVVLSRSFLLGSIRFDAGAQCLGIPAGGSHRLSRGDCALLSAFCLHPGEILSRPQLLRATGSLVAPGQSRTIDVRLSRLRRTLREIAGEDLIVPERGLGYRLVVAVTPCADDPTAH